MRLGVPPKKTATAMLNAHNIIPNVLPKLSNRGKYELFQRTTLKTIVIPQQENTNVSVLPT